MANLKKQSFTLLNRFEVLLLSVFSSLKVHVSDYCDISTSEGVSNIVMKDGSMISIIQFDGVKSIPSDDSFHQLLVELTNKLSVYLSKSGHGFGMVFKRDLNPTSDLYRVAEIQKTTAYNLNLDVADLIDENINVYSRFVYDETNYIVLISRPHLLDASEVKLEQKNKIKFINENKLASAVDAQNALLPSTFLKSTHETYVDGVMSVFSSPQYKTQAKLLNVVEALRSIKKAVSPLNTSQQWKPIIPNDPTSNLFNSPESARKFLARWKTNTIVDDISHHLWQPLNEQIMLSPIVGATRHKFAEYPSGSVLVEDRIYCPLLVDAPPSQLVTFNDLFNNMNNASTRLANGQERAIPFAISFMLKGDGLANTMLKRTLSKVFAFASSDNASIKSAFQTLNDYQNQGGTTVSLQISAMTWAENTPFGLDEVQIRRSKLWKTLEAWGGSHVIEKGGDPILGLTTNIHGLSVNHHAPMYASPLYEALRFMPWLRQASPFPTGSILNRTMCGKLMAHDSFSPELNSWVKVYVGKAGTGKSVALNNDIYQACLKAGTTRLPYVFIVDVGISSRGVIELIQDRLPLSSQYLATYKRLQNDVRSAINPLECSVGLMMPTNAELAQIVAFLSTLITPIESMSTPERGLSNFLTQIITHTFISKMDNNELGRPNIYEKNKDAELDEILAENNITAVGNTYYFLRDLCHKKGLYRARDLCHRYAMPLLQDAIAVANSNDEIRNRYSTVTTANSSETIIEMFTRGTAEACSMYSIFTSHTKFDVDTARIVSLDLQDVIGKNPKQSSLFFQIARIFAKKRISYTDDDVELFPTMYQAYYSKLIKEISEDKKIIAYDEMHHAKKDVSLFAELERDCREARKWNMELKFASQLPQDFGDVLGLATEILIADKGSQEIIDYYVKVLGLQPEEVQALKNYVSLTPNGLVYLYRVTTKKQTYVFISILSIGAKLMWSLTTDADDRVMRSTMYSLIGNRTESIKILAQAFPSGGAKVAINSRKEQLRRTGTILSEDKEEQAQSISLVIAKEIVKNYRS